MTDLILTTLKVAGIFVICYPVMMTAIIIGCKCLEGKKVNAEIKALPKAV